MPADKSEHTKTHHECKCAECSVQEAMAERMEAWKAAANLLKDDITWAEDDQPTVRETLVLANWLYYGAQESDD